MKFPAILAAALTVLSGCSPPDEKVRTAEEAVAVARQRCHKDAIGSGWRAERKDDTWIARFGEADAQGRYRFTARIKAADGKPVCEVTMSWTEGG